MHTLKEQVHNKARPKMSITKAYIADECLTFCSRYLHRVEIRFNYLERNEDGRDSQHRGLSDFMKLRKPLGQANIKIISHEDWNCAHLDILGSSDEVQPFVGKKFIM